MRPIQGQYAWFSGSCQTLLHQIEYQLSAWPSSGLGPVHSKLGWTRGQSQCQTKMNYLLTPGLVVAQTQKADECQMKRTAIPVIVWTWKKILIGKVAQPMGFVHLVQAVYGDAIPIALS